ncbi:MAG: type III pantothenate kinase, partial [Ignavibacteriae bacterium]|nr:type III pantothenate kinase [Ignavibacteriota bacterium]
MILVFDIGNTATKLGLCKAAAITFTTFISTSSFKDVGMMERHIRFMLKARKTRIASLHSVVVASVVPSVTEMIEQLF